MLPFLVTSWGNLMMKLESIATDQQSVLTYAILSLAVAALTIGAILFAYTWWTYLTEDISYWSGKQKKKMPRKSQWKRKKAAAKAMAGAAKISESAKPAKPVPVELLPPATPAPAEPRPGPSTMDVTFAEPYKKKSFDEYFKEIQQRINSWNKQELTDRCKTLRIHSKSIGELKGKLKHIYKQHARSIHKRMASAPPVSNSFTYFDYLVVIDFEATCIENGPATYLHEIIQFPAVLVDVRRQIIVDKFCVYVKPSVNPILSEFCKKLTGITQDEVNSAPDFVEALSMFKNWLKLHQLGTHYKYALVCDGQFDMGRFLYLQCEISKIPYVQEALYWVNLRKCFKSFYGVKWVSLRMVLDVLGLPFLGRPHNGLDDSFTIASVLLRLVRDGCVIQLNEKIVLKKSDQDRIAREPKTCFHQLDTVQALSRSDFLNVYNAMNFERQQARKFAESAEKPEPKPKLTKDNYITVSVLNGRSKKSSNKRYVKKHPNNTEETDNKSEEIPVVSFAALLQEE